MTSLILIAISTLISEDLACVAAGALIARGSISFAGGVFACISGIYAGDLLLFAAGRFAGHAILRWIPARRFISAERVDQASAWLAQRGASLVFLSRFTPGLRLPTYFAAGLLRTSFWKFASYFLIASVLWTPFLIGLTIWLGSSVLRAALTHSFWAVLPVFLTIVTLWTLRNSLGRLKRWEFWPVWLAYLPVIPYLLFLALKHRSLTLFTLSNPGISTGGFAGESKSQILDHLSRTDGVVPAYRLVSSASAALSFLQQHDLTWPVVLKPDTGERGSGVTIVRSEQEVRRYFETAQDSVIVQQYVEGPEFGVFYVRIPGTTRGHITSITEKRFAHVTGDGVKTIRQLIQSDRRAANLVDVYLKSSHRDPNNIPATGERIQLSEIGSHCRGAIFLDGGRLKSPELEDAVDRIAKAHPGFYFGRFDLRAASIDDFRAGRTLQVIELNGVSAEPTHVYDPAVSLIEAYRVVFRHWRTAFQIGALNRQRGHAPASIASLLSAIHARPAYACSTATFNCDQRSRP